MAWILIGAAVALVAFVFTAFGLPSATLFAALLVGVLVSVRKTEQPPRKLPPLANRIGQACIGVLIGALVQPSALGALASDWLVILAATLVTLVLSLVAGIVLGLHRDLDPVTGSFALVAGGASGLTAISQELGADQRVVAVVQYLRVLVIVVAMPVVATALPSGDGTSGAAPAGEHAPLVADLLFTACCAAIGVLLAKYLPKVPAVALLGPMAIAAVLTATGVSQGATVPDPIEQVAYALIGLQVGLSFTRESLRSVRRVLPLALTLVVALLVATAAIGIPLLSLAGASPLDAYLATTPGGLYAVLATATSTGADTTLILTVQVLRVLVMLLLAPAIAMLLSGKRARKE
ncbi:AbrB family transcriptional regulator [Cryptosporangium aurantiacum]|uniref:Ammonia monooxygenase n=1 Tax=Cryptosporangium aurantiacum TaxID=134849 RepID=A0A1M7RCM2_9ACTN|nr:AbrB family transcriptional regulator [Cryptosporangium aurantiacum]SHN44033.1 hypothetical protein SAMN05443668_11026 [Cryptosporangium aurantiacum]